MDDIEPYPERNSFGGGAGCTRYFQPQIYLLTQMVLYGVENKNDLNLFYKLIGR